MSKFVVFFDIFRYFSSKTAKNKFQRNFPSVEALCYVCVMMIPAPSLCLPEFSLLFPTFFLILSSKIEFQEP